MGPYKLRIYKKSGDLDREEHFLDAFALVNRYREIFVKWSPVNPTAWYLPSNMDAEWVRLSGF